MYHSYSAHRMKGVLQNSGTSSLKEGKTVTTNELWNWTLGFAFHYGFVVSNKEYPQELGYMRSRVGFVSVPPLGK